MKFPLSYSLKIQYLYIVMELLRGGELYQNICGRSVLSEEEAYKIIVPLAECLSYMHSMGIIHRDIKVLTKKCS